MKKCKNIEEKKKDLNNNYQNALSSLKKGTKDRKKVARNLSKKMSKGWIERN